MIGVRIQWRNDSLALDLRPVAFGKTMNQPRRPLKEGNIAPTIRYLRFYRARAFASMRAALNFTHNQRSHIKQKTRLGGRVFDSRSFSQALINQYLATTGTPPKLK
jgi:hypothetical protein